MHYRSFPAKPCLGLALLSVAILVLAPCGTVHCQVVPRTSLVGTVVDETTGKPVPYVNVYIAGSTLGSATDERGRFNIRSIPVGVHEVVGSHIGYAPYSSRVTFVEGRERTIRIVLKPRAVELDEVEVTSEDPTEWRKNLTIFKDLFLGSTRNATLCTLENPEVLDFRTDESGTFLATARSSLMLENRALGYMIEYAVEFFSYDGDYLRVSAKPRFVQLKPGSELEKEAWERNRIRAYRGSLRHFLVALIHRRVLQEGFRVRAVEALGKTPRLEARSSIDWESLIVGSDVSYETTIRFDEFLEVEYWGEDIETGYSLLRRGQSERQTSWIKMNGALITVSAEGNIREPFPLTVFGYWAWERVADTLPSDYLPPALPQD